MSQLLDTKLFRFLLQCVQAVQVEEDDASPVPIPIPQQPPESLATVKVVILETLILFYNTLFSLSTASQDLGSDESSNIRRLLLAVDEQSLFY